MEVVRVLDPHRGQPVIVAGASAGEAKAAILAVHGRGARPEDILTLAEQLDLQSFAFYAPQAADHAWYPNRFSAPLSSNEPWLSSALALLERALDQIAGAGIPPERTLLLGFSQGACLALEFAARHARRYGGLVGLSGALIGPDDAPRSYPGSLAGTPVFLGCSDVDPHVAKERVLQSGEVLRAIGGSVTVRLYPGLEHTVNQEEIEFVGSMAHGALAQGK
jgi:predicted esterase